MSDNDVAGKPVAPLTEEQRYVFDTRGWLVVPGVIAPEQLAPMREFFLRLHQQPESIPEAERSTMGGPLQALLDHPLVVAFMDAFVAYPDHRSARGYGFRCENSFGQWRKAGSDNFFPHGGGGLFNMPGDSHTYRCHPGRAHSGLTRVVWELGPVERGSGGTLFLSGSHKAAFPAPASCKDPASPLWDTYACPAGSALFFTEGITHTGTRWTSAHDRLAVFNAYNTVDCRWHRWEPDPRVVAAMPPMRRSLFRGTFSERNQVADA